MPQNKQLTKRNQDTEISPAVRSPFSRFFDEAFWDPFHLFDTSLMPLSDIGNQFSPLVDVSETEKEVIIEADIPNIDPKNISVDVANNMLTISGTQEEGPKTEGRRWHRRERGYSYTEFTRQILLPEYADGNKAECTMKHGTLTVTIPKRPEAKAKHLDVKVESEK